MNLTKRILTGLTAAGLCALTASAATFEDVFEASEKWFTWPPDGTDTVETNAHPGLPLRDYKTELTQTGGNIVTNAIKWIVEGGDSAIVSYENGEAKYQGEWPTNAASKDQYLSLNTEGKLATRIISTEDDPETLGDDPIYVDTLIKFTVSDGEPEITDTDAKLAIWVNEASNLVIKSTGVIGDPMDEESEEEWSTTEAPICTTNAGTVINPDQWYRLTVATIDETGFAGYCKIWLNGQPLKGPLNLSTTEIGGDLTGFPFIKSGGTTLQQVSFQGTGCIDDLVVTRATPSFGASTAFVLTIAYDSSMLDVAGEGFADSKLESGKSLTITAKPWYRITGISGDGVTASGGTFPATSATVTLTADADSRTATIAAEKVNDQRAGKLADWAIAHGVSETDATGGAFAAYLLNVAPNATNTAIKITKIDIDPATGEVSIDTQADDGNVDITQRNGKLVLEAAENLNADFSEVGFISLTNIVSEKKSIFSGIDFNAKDRQFFKVILKDNIEEPPPATE